MSYTAAPAGPDRRPSAPIAPRRLRSSGRKNAHRGLAACRSAASGKTRSQALTASGKTCRSPTTSHRTSLLPQSKPCGGGGTSISNEWAAGADAGLTATDISLQGAGRLTENIQAPPDVNLGAIGVLGHAVTAFGLAISGYQAIFGSTAQAREQGAQDTAVNAFGARFPAAAPFTTIPYDIGRLAREIYDAWQSAQAEKIFQEAAQCTYSK
jgi:hypothetical protein